VTERRPGSAGTMSGSLRAVLFDVDGTLVDTNYLHTVTWWQAFAQGGQHVPMADIHRAIGMGSDQLLDRLLPDNRDKDADSGLTASHDALYATYWTRLRPLPGAVELLRACKKRGLTVVLASSAGEAESGVLRGVLDAEDAIDAATFSGDVERTKPAPDLVEVALEKAAVPAERAVFVGDTVWDAQASRKAGVPCIGLLSGGIGREELADAGAAQIYAGPGELLDRLSDSLIRN
jgi:HAD superfamily hydrolase (TIGR01509 family)